MEDKKCRLCGYADLANTNIFTMSAKFVEKIVAVFPIVLYSNDPLPKHICKKCVSNVGNTYGDIERALKNQNKWISNVRSVQPDNSYVKVVDTIDSSNKQTSELVSKVAGEDIGERTVCHLFNIKIDDQNGPVKQPRNSLRPILPSCADKVAPVPVQMEVDVDISGFSCIEPVKAEQPAQTSLNKPATKITQLKSALELNGCTLTKLKSPPKAVSEPVPHEVLPEIQDIKIEIKEEPPFYEEYTQSLNAVECKMCPFRCETVEELAIHQLNHLRIPLTKILDRRFLDKRIRRGRLIRIEEKKCIRCLNCWRIFVDNKSILHHWSIGDCEFFCRICGKEFASSPKMLREHVPAAHGISYRSSKLLRAPPAIIARPIKAEKPDRSPMKSEPSPTKSPKGSTPSVALSVKVACNICLKVFANFKARNSHMRAHKHPPLLPPLKTSTFTDTLMAFNRNHTLPPVKQEPEDYDNIPFHVVKSQDATTPSTSKVVPPPRAALYPQLRSPPSKTPQRQNVAIRTNGPPGVRTKFVQSRPDPNAIVFKTEPRSTTQLLKVKSLVDLQDPSISSQHAEAFDKSSLRVGPQPENGVASSNGVGVAGGGAKDNMNYAQIFNCHPCGGKFTSKLELFRHKRKCTANNLYPCQFCDRHFLTSADLQMHIMLLHKNSASMSALM